MTLSELGGKAGEGAWGWKAKQGFEPKALGKQGTHWG